MQLFTADPGAAIAEDAIPARCRDALLSIATHLRECTFATTPRYGDIGIALSDAVDAVVRLSRPRLRVAHARAT